LTVGWPTMSCSPLHPGLTWAAGAELIPIGLDTRRWGNPMKERKVFVIGFHKTGTSSLHMALRRLAYSVCDLKHVRDLDLSEGSWHVLRNLINRYDAFRGQPWPLFFRQTYDYRPQSKFILTIRPTEAWLTSATKYFGAKTSEKREAIYGVGSPIGHEPAYAARYDRHNQDVMQFFADKPGSLLVMDLAAGAGWRELCTFLGEKTLPARDFPHRSPDRKRMDQGRKTDDIARAGPAAAPE
jgi:hypothetical protein